mmetsp:Transcript_20906/g.37252  ORF Transcript_20906/g.37252 Transcript_20906/m.37252 type:complete len:259 (-) Transcript_20906:441-1217(-)
MVSVIDDDNFVLSLLITIFIQLAFFAGAVATKSEKLYDFAGGLNYIIVFIATFLLAQNGNNTRGLVLTILVSVSRSILAGFLLYRVLSRKGDARFDSALEDPCKFLIFWVFQMAWVFLIASPVIYVNGSGKDPSLGPTDYVGFALIGIGMVFQLVADLQKFAFRKDPSNRGKICDVGVWAVSRHPNYFGEICIWWGAFFTTILPLVHTNEYWAIWTIASPIFTMFLLLFVSGIPLAEGQALKRFMKTPADKERSLQFY